LLSDGTPVYIFFLVPLLVNWHASVKWRPKLMHATFLVLLCASVFIHSRGATSVDVYRWNDEPADVNDNQARLWDWHDPQFLRGLFREPSPKAVTENMQRTDRMPRYSLDESGFVDAEELQTGLFSSRMFRVSGWALDPAGSTAGGVEVVVDG